MGGSLFFIGSLTFHPFQQFSQVPLCLLLLSYFHMSLILCSSLLPLITFQLIFFGISLHNFESFCFVHCFIWSSSLHILLLLLCPVPLVHCLHFLVDLFTFASLVVFSTCQFYQSLRLHYSLFNFYFPFFTQLPSSSVCFNIHLLFFLTPSTSQYHCDYYKSHCFPNLAFPSLVSKMPIDIINS